MSIKSLVFATVMITLSSAHAAPASLQAPAPDAMHGSASFSELVQPASIVNWSHTNNTAHLARASSISASDTERPSSLLLASLAAVGFVARRRQGLRG